MPSASASEVDMSLTTGTGSASTGKKVEVPSACRGVPTAEEAACRQHIYKGGMAKISDIPPFFYDVLSENTARRLDHQGRLFEHWAWRKIKKARLHSVPSHACGICTCFPLCSNQRVSTYHPSYWNSEGRNSWFTRPERGNLCGHVLAVKGTHHWGGQDYCVLHVL